MNKYKVKTDSQILKFLEEHKGEIDTNRLEFIYCKVCSNFIGIKLDEIFVIGNSILKGKLICGCGKCFVYQNYKGEVVQETSEKLLIESYAVDTVKYINKNNWFGIR